MIIVRLIFVMTVLVFILFQFVFDFKFMLGLVIGHYFNKINIAEIYKFVNDVIKKIEYDIDDFKNSY